MPQVRSRGRTIAFSVILVVIVLLVVESFARLAYHTIYDQSYRPKKLRKLTAESWMFGGEETGVPEFLSGLMIHPYLGFGVNAEGKAKEGLGFAQGVSPLESLKQEDKLRVLVLGGSVAAQLLQPERADGGSFLQNALDDALEYRSLDLEVWMFHGALPGGKQPQQFIAYSYLLTQGAEFDLILNLDGFNEMTMAMLEGKPKGMHPAYPRGWDIMLGNRLTGPKLRKIAQLLKVREEQASLIDFALSSPLARSALVGLFLAQKVVANEARARVLVEETERNKQQGELSLEEGGIPFDYDDEQEAYRYLALLWQRSSTLLSQLAKNNDAEYLHLFQPNQYLDGSKKLTEEEREKYYVPDDFFGPVYRAAYPHFRQQMDELLMADEWFVDASMVFKDEEQTVYSDGCCHFNERGLALLAEFVANEIVVRSEKLQTVKDRSK